MAPLGHRVLVLDEVGSTNDALRDLALAGEPEGTVVVARRQVAGRGRAGRAWSSPPGGLWLSLLLRPRAPPDGWGVLPLLAGLGVAAAARGRGIDARVKWPNDVVVGDAKLAGVLLESRLGPDAFVVAGVGLNANVARDDLPAGATSLLAETGTPADLDRLAADVLREVESRYRAWGASGAAAVLGEYGERSATLGRRVKRRGGAAGLAVAVLEDGRLLLEGEDGARRAIAADDVDPS